MKYLSYILFSCMILSMSCKEVKSLDAEYAFDLKNAQNASINDAFDSVEVIPLLFNGENYPGSVAQMRVEDGLIIIQDNRNVIHTFTDDGRSIASSADKIGQGPGEYTLITGFEYNNTNNHISIFTPIQILEYDPKFNFIRDSPLPDEESLYISKGYVLNATEGLATPNSANKSPYRILKYNISDGRIINDLSYEESVVAGISMQGRSFFNTEKGEILYVPNALTYCVFSIGKDGNTISKKYSFNMGSESIDKVADGSNDEAWKNNLLRTDKVIPLSIMPAENRIFIVAKAGDTLRDFIVYTVKTDESRCLKSPIYDGSKYVFPFIRDVRNGYAYAAIEKEVLKHSPELLMTDAAKADSIIEAIEDESLIIMRYRMK